MNALVNSVTSFSSDRIEHNLGGIGITFGDGEKVVAKSVALILDTEKERLKPYNVVHSIDKEFKLEEDEIGMEY